MAEEVGMLEGEAVSRWFYIELHCQGAPEHDLEDQLDPIMQALLAEPGDFDADLSADLAAGTIDFHVSVKADDQPSALSLAQAYVRSALHAAGVSTPEWERLADLVERGDAVPTVRPSDLVEADCS
jgi:hypothetical protein